jgi:hypothetical protein
MNPRLGAILFCEDPNVKNRINVGKNKNFTQAFSLFRRENPI